MSQDSGTELPKGQPKEEKRTTNEVELDKPVAQALAQGLSQQIFPTESLAMIMGHTANLKNVHGINQEWLTYIGSSTSRIFTLIGDIGRAKEVKLVDFDDKKTGTDFKFSDEKDNNPEKPNPGEIVIDEELSLRIISALQHNFSNALGPIPGFAELIHVRVKNPYAKDQAEEIMNRSGEMLTRFKDIAKAGHKMRLFTDNEGKTSISLIPVPQQQTADNK